MKRAFFVLGCLLAASLFAQQIPPRPEALTYKTITFQPPAAKDHKAILKNGIPAFLVPDTSTGLVRIDLLVRGGGYMDPSDKAGLAQAFGGQWRAGGTLKTKAEDLDEQLAFLAASLNSTCSATQAALRLQVLGKDLEEGLRLMMEVLLEPAFAPDRLDLMKKSTLQGIEARNDSVMSIAGYQVPFLLNGERHFSGRLVNAASLEAITPGDLKAFHARLMHPANMMLAVSGKFDRPRMMALLEQNFGKLKPLPSAAAAPAVPAPMYDRKPGIYVCHKDVPQSLVFMAIPGLRRNDPDWFPTLVANEILGGGGMTARLMKKLRSDEGLTYGVYSSFSQGPYYRGDWSVQFQTKNRSVPYAIGLVLEQIERIKNEPVSDDDLKVVKGILVDAFPNQFESAQAVANVFANDAAIGWPEGYTATFREKVLAVTKADIQRVARKYFDLAKAVVFVAGSSAEAQAGDEKDHPGLLKDVLPLPVVLLPLRDPKTLKPIGE